MEISKVEELHLLEKDAHIFLATKDEQYNGKSALEAFEITEKLGEVNSMVNLYRAGLAKFIKLLISKLMRTSQLNF